MNNLSAPVSPPTRTPFYRDSRILGILAQIIFVIVIVAVAAFLINNMTTRLRASNSATGGTLSWNFLNQTAGFAIAEGPAFSPSESYARAFLIGIQNTLRVAFIGIVLATLLGVLTGIARLSNNWLLRTLAGGYVEIIRSTPLLVQLFFWYFAFILKLPDVKTPISIPGLAILSNRGAVISWPYLTEVGRNWTFWVLGAIVLALLIAYVRRRQLNALGRIDSVLPLAFLTFLAVAIIGYLVTYTTGQLPQNLSYELRRGDRGTLYVDANGNGAYDLGVDQTLRFVPVTLTAEDGTELGTVHTDAQGGFRFYNLEQEGSALTWEKPSPIYR